MCLRERERKKIYSDIAGVIKLSSGAESGHSSSDITHTHTQSGHTHTQDSVRTLGNVLLFL